LLNALQFNSALGLNILIKMENVNHAHLEFLNAKMKMETSNLPNVLIKEFLKMISATGQPLL